MFCFKLPSGGRPNNALSRLGSPPGVGGLMVDGVCYQLVFLGPEALTDMIWATNSLRGHDTQQMANVVVVDYSHTTHIVQLFHHSVPWKPGLCDRTVFPLVVMQQSGS